MYAALWRLLPGPLWLRVLLAVVVVAGIVALLMFVIYPWAAVVFTPNVESTVT